MKDPEITALAHEYAEWVTKAEGGNNAYIPAEMAIASAFLRWLSRRFCFVEKSKLKEMYKEAAEGKCELEEMQPQNTYAKNSILMKVGMNAGCAYTLKHLFPEIAKEVER